jgi:glyoxylase-like metal-dependent hydrolase (beta-lactamase superfamily II)
MKKQNWKGAFRALIFLVVGMFIAIYLMFRSDPLPFPETLKANLPNASPPKEMAIYKILTGVNHRTAAFAYRGGSFFEKRDLSMIALLVKHPKGDILIDAGFGRDCQSHFESMPLYFRMITDFDPGTAAIDQLKTVAYPTDSLSGILLTHAHWDHVSGIPDFPKIPVFINNTEELYINSGDRLSQLIHDFPNVIYKEYEFKNQPYLNFSQSCDLYEDGSIVIVPAPGHTPGSVIVFVNIPDGKRYALIGDLAWQKEGVLLREERPWLQSTLGDYNRHEVCENLLKMAAIAEKYPQIQIVPAHDARGFEDIPNITSLSSSK